MNKLNVSARMIMEVEDDLNALMCQMNEGIWSCYTDWILDMTNRRGKFLIPQHSETIPGSWTWRCWWDWDLILQEKKKVNEKGTCTSDNAWPSCSTISIKKNPCTVCHHYSTNYKFMKCPISQHKFQEVCSHCWAKHSFYTFIIFIYYIRQMSIWFSL